MLLYLTEFLSQFYSPFSVFNDSTILRSIMAMATALLISLIAGPKLIERLSVLKYGQPIRDDGPQTHLVKAGTPTMGGVLILLSISIGCFLWGNLESRVLWIVLLSTLAFGLVGAVDDLKKLKTKSSDGLSAKAKYAGQSIIALVVGAVLYYTAQSPAETTLIMPFVKDFSLELGAAGFIIFTYFVIVGTSNAVNLTDGLDGLAIMPSVMVAAGLSVFAYLGGHKEFAEYLNLPRVSGMNEMMVFGAAFIGAGLGFLWFNSYPADVFMGDVGSLALGAALGTMAVVVRQEFVLVIMGGVFVMETLSVILQVGSYKLRGKRIFRMAPIHHHFELKGWPEPKVIVRFWIITVILVLIGLASIKIR